MVLHGERSKMKLIELLDMLNGVSKNGGATGKPREIHLGIRDS